MMYNKYVENIFSDKFLSNFDILKKVFSAKNCLFIVLTFMLSMQSFIGDSFPFSYAMIGVASVFNVPLILVLIAGLAAMVVAKFSAILILKLFICFVLFTLITALINIEGISKRYVILIKLVVSAIVTEVIIMLFGNVPDLSLFYSIYTVISIAAFYLIFMSGIYVILNLGKGFVYSKEESLAMVAVITVALGMFRNLNILDFSIMNTLGTALILVYGWKNGSVAGCSAGLIVGLLLSTTGNTSMLFISTLTFAGFASGLLNRFGKFGVIVGFVLGNIAINYWVNGFSELTVRVGEMLVASIGLILVPKSLEVKLDKIFNKNSTMKSAYESVLDYGSDVKNRLGAVSEVFDNLASITIPLTQEDLEETREVIKRYILEYTENNCIDCKNRKKCTSSDKLGITVDYIASKLESNENIDAKMLTFECNNSEEIIKDIKEVYNSMKLMRIIKQKEKDNSIKLSNQYKEVSKIISSIAENINKVPAVKNKYQSKLRDELKIYGYLVYEDIYDDKDGNVEYTFVTDILTDIDKQKKQIITIASEILEQNMVIKLILNSSKTEKSKVKLISKPKFEIETGILNYKKDGEEVSGDAYISMELPDLQQLVAISDGAGTGINAAKSSKAVINMLEKLLNGGFEQSKAIEIINSIIKMKTSESHFATLDTVIINLKNAEAQFIKLGAAPTYMMEDGKLSYINNCNIPIGILNDTEYVPIVKKLKNNTILVQISDGVISDKMDINNNYFTKYLQQIDLSKNSRTISEELYKTVLRENSNILTDDVTIVVSKVKENMVG